MKNFLLTAVVFAVGLVTFVDGAEIKSPDGKIGVQVSEKEGRISYSVAVDGKTVIHESKLGLTVADPDLQKRVTIAGVETSSHDEVWKPVAGRYSEIRNCYNEMTVNVTLEGSTYAIVFRAYDDGVAFRYVVKENKDLLFNADESEVNLVNDGTIWATNNENHNIGPVSILSEKCPKKLIAPVVFQNDDVTLAVAESAIFTEAPFAVKVEAGGKLAFDAPKLKNTDTKTSWRTIILGKTPGDMITSTLIKNLNPAPTQDFSWVKPGKSMWDWRVAKYEAPDGFVYGLNTTSHKRFIDFASENGVEYLLMDADWYGPEFSKDSDPTKAQGDIDVRENFAYAKEKGVGLILYLNDIGAKKFGLERVLKQFHDWGASGVKYGFMTGKGREKVLYTRHVTELCAKYKLMVNYHDIPIPPSGDDRTYPNLVTREFCHSQADAHRSYFPETAVSACFVNQIVGPLDECNCWYDLNNAHSRTKVFQPIPGTVAAENAKLVVYYSPLTVLPDAPEAYLAKKDLFEFVKQLPNTFDDMVVMNDVIGESVTIARKKDDSWYVGSLTNRDGRTLDIPLTFLDEGEYVATIYRDADDAHYLENKEAYAVETKTVTKDDVIKAKLAPGGGHSMVLVKKR